MKRKLYLILFSVLVFINPLAAQNEDISKISDAIDTLAEKVAPALPAASGIGLDWSDSYIGSVVGVPPHFGLGFTVGTATIPSKGLEPIFNALGKDVPSAISTMGLPLPIYNLNARVGGFMLPFDAGLKLGFVPTGALKSLGSDFDVDYFLIGGDIRYALMQDSLVSPDISIGLGVNYLSTNLSYTFKGVGQNFNLANGDTLKVSDPKATFEIKSLSWDLKAQISKDLIILTPYLGAAATLSYTSVLAKLKSDLSYNNTTLSSTEIDYLNSATGLNVSSNSISKTNNQNGKLSFRIWGGTSINILLIKLDLQALYNMPTGNLGASIGTRFQL